MTQDNLDKAMKLMAEALKQYEEGKFELAEHSRKTANQMFDSVSNELSTDEGIEKVMYGENRNFGIIYNTIEANTKKLYESKEGKKKIGELVNFIRNNNVLLNEFKVYNAFTKPINVEDAKEYVNEAVSVIKRMPKSVIIENNHKLIEKIKELGLNEAVTITDSENELFEAIEYTIFNAPTVTNINEYANVKKIIVENVELNNEVRPEAMDLDEMYEKKVNEISEKYNNVLNSDEIRLIEEISSSPEKAEKTFNKFKKQTLDSVKKRMDESSDDEKESWKKVYEAVLNKQFDHKNSLSIIADMISLNETAL